MYNVASSGSSDNTVNLWRISSISSLPYDTSPKYDPEASAQDPEAAAASEEVPDLKVKCMDQHEESVYGVAWSASEAWMYASLSLDGRVILNQIPSSEKYKILL